MQRFLSGSRRKFIVDLLPIDERKLLLDDCSLVRLEYGSVLYEPPLPVRHVHFPTTGFVSLIKTVNDGSSIEIGMVGSEGLFGNEFNTVDDVATITALVQGGGEALRMPLHRFREHLSRSSAIRTIVHHHSSYQLRQMAQTIACGRFHVIEQRLARWLLMTSDRAASPVFPVTHEFLSYMLGSVRSAVTVAMGALRRRGLIDYRRSEVHIIDLRGLVAAACTCFQVDLDAYRNELAFRQTVR